MSFSDRVRSVIVSRGATMALGFASSVILARILGPEGRGELEIIFVSTAIVIGLGTFGVDNANIFLAARDSRFTLNLMRGANLIYLAVAALVLTTIAWTFPGLIDLSPEGFASLEAVIVGYIVLELAGRMFNAVLIGTGEIVRVNTLTVWRSVFYVAFLPLSFALSGPTPVAAFQASIAAAAIQVALIFAAVNRKSGSWTSFTLGDSLHWFRSSIGYGIRDKAGGAFEGGIQRVDVFLVAYFLGYEQVGLYAIAYLVVAMLMKIPLTFFYLIFSEFARNDPDDRVKAERVSRLLVTLATVGTLMTLVAIPFLLIPIYGTAFAPSVLPLEILLLSVPFQAIQYVLQAHFYGEGRPQVYTVIIGLALVVNVIGNLIAIPAFGIAGAALTTTIAYVFSASLHLWELRRSGGSPRSLVLATRSDCSEALVFLRSNLKGLRRRKV